MTSTPHPEELLADYVKGTLVPDERALVESHLSTCGRCREEVELARSAVQALASLEDRPVPLGVTGPVLAEAGRRFERRRAAVWERLQWGAGIAAAAALVLVVALNVGDDGGGALRATDEMAAAPTGGAPAAFEAIEDLEKQDRRYSDDDVRVLLGDAAAAARDLEQDRTVTEAAAGGADVQFVPAERGIECLRAADVTLDDATAETFRLFEARYGRTPAYFAVFLQGPGAGQPADTVSVWVVAKRDCRILTFASQPI
jgi:hypothetical protein